MQITEKRILMPGEAEDTQRYRDAYVDADHTGMGDGGRHAVVFKAAGRIQSLVLQEQVAVIDPDIFRDMRRVLQNRLPLSDGDNALFRSERDQFAKPPDTAEVERLMTLFVESLEREVEELHANGVRVRFIGERAELGPLLAGAMAATEARTGANQGLELIIAVAYGGRWDLVQAARRLASAAQSGRLDPAQLDDSVFAGALATAGLPPIDLLVRTGGEQRISNFMLWDLAYSELYFSTCLWPEFDRAELERAFEFYASRQRRFGLTGQQVGSGAC